VVANKEKYVKMDMCAVKQAQTMLTM